MVEMTLRRRNYEVFRDEHAFECGRDLVTEINNHIHRANVFIALWCREYACSPWCYDELDLALDRAEAREMRLWLLCLDNTRIVPPKARKIITHKCEDRAGLESKILQLLDRTQDSTI